MHAHARSCTLTHAHGRSCTLMHAHARSCTLMHAHARTHTQHGHYHPRPPLYFSVSRTLSSIPSLYRAWARRSLSTASSRPRASRPENGVAARPFDPFTPRARGPSAHDPRSEGGVCVSRPLSGLPNTRSLSRGRRDTRGEGQSRFLTSAHTGSRRRGRMRSR